MGVGSKARWLKGGGRNKVEARWARVEDPAKSSRAQQDPASDVICHLSRRGGEAPVCLIQYATTQSNDSMTLADIAVPVRRSTEQ